jgi:nucleotide-binding universal stress UspA family protein
MTIRTILCPVDFSDASQHAAEHAIAIARWYGATIRALHVYAPPFAPVPGIPPPADRVPESEAARVRSEVEALFAEGDPRRLEAVVDVGHAAFTILDRARTCDLIVMGTHGANGFERLMLGSVTEKVLRRASCPVLTVPPRAVATSTLPFRQLLCAIDFSESSLAGLDMAASLAREAGAALTLQHVIEWPWHEPPPPSLTDLPPAQASALDEFRRYLTTMACNRLRDLARDVDCRASWRVAHGKPYTELLRTAAEPRADLIVIGVHGRNAADMMLFGSTTNQVVRRASCPVLTIRQKNSEGTS